MSGKGMNRFEDKERRKQRRHNHIARDLRTPKYRQRVVKDKRKQQEPIPIEDYTYFDENEEPKRPDEWYDEEPLSQ